MLNTKNKRTRVQSVNEIDLASVDLSNAEIAFSSVLQGVIGSQNYVFGKVRAADMFSANKTTTALSSRLLLSRRYFFDFVICDKLTHQIKCVVELKTSAQKNLMKSIWQRRQERTVQAFCRETKLPLMLVNQQRGYSLNDLIERYEATIAQYAPIVEKVPA